MSHPILRLLSDTGFVSNITGVSQSENLDFIHNQIVKIQEYSCEPDYDGWPISDTALHIAEGILNVVIDSDSHLPIFAFDDEYYIGLLWDTDFISLSVNIHGNEIKFSSSDDACNPIFEPINVHFNDDFIDQINEERFTQGLYDTRKLLAKMSGNLLRK